MKKMKAINSWRSNNANSINGRFWRKKSVAENDSVSYVYGENAISGSVSASQQRKHHQHRRHVMKMAGSVT